MDLPNILNTKGSAAVAGQQLHPQFAQQAGVGVHVNGAGAVVESADGRVGLAGMPYGAGVGPRSQPLHNMGIAGAQQQQQQQLRYNDVPQQYQQQFPVISNPYPTPTGSVEGGFAQVQPEEEPKTGDVSPDGAAWYASGSIPSLLSIPFPNWLIGSNYRAHPQRHSATCLHAPQLQ